MRSDRVKEARKLGRRSVRTERRRFLADGPKAVTEALAAGCVEEVFATAEVADRLSGPAGAAYRLSTVDDRAIAALSDSVTPAGVVAVCRFLEQPEPAELLGRASLLAVCVEVRDPGNAGTVIRCADAAGADGVVLVGDAVDIYNSKAVRASVGSLFHLPVLTVPEPVALLESLRAAGLTSLAADGAGESDLFDTPPPARVAWLLGNEAHGLPPEVLAAADGRVRIPIHGRAESLNLSTAAALCLYESARHRRP